MSIQFLIIICVVLIVLIFLMRNLGWVIEEIRNICEDESGYVKLIQLVFVFLILISFFILLIYNLFYRTETSRLDVFLTVIVGLIGTMVGTFFSEKSMESIKKDRDKKRKAIIEKTVRLKQYQDLVKKLMEKLS